MKKFCKNCEDLEDCNCCDCRKIIEDKETVCICGCGSGTCKKETM